MDSDAELDYQIEREMSDELECAASQPCISPGCDGYDSPPDDSTAYEELLRAIDVDEERLAEELYKNRNNGCGMQKSWKMVNLEDIEQMGINDGMPYFFLSEAEGPMLSGMALKQLLVLLHMIHSSISGDHVVETLTLKPTINADNILEKLVEVKDVGDNPYNFTGDYEKALEQGVDDMAFEKVFDFRGCGGTAATVNRVVSVGEILVCPVSATYTKDVSSLLW
jgi:hypothetical protein